MTVGNAASPKYRGRRWMVRIGATLLVTLIVVSTVGWLYFLGKIGRTLLSWILP
jgi:hypothetical protein